MRPGTTIHDTFANFGRPAIFVCSGIVFWFVVTCQLGAVGLTNDAEEDVLPQPCATDPVYLEFEKVQADAYLSDTGLQFRRLLTPDLEKKTSQEVSRELQRRITDQTGVFTVSPGIERTIETELAHMKVPTCYESPPLYFMIEKYAGDVETARRELRLSLSERPRFGSLPSNDINAYTYPSSDGRGGVIAINSQLFTFIYQMTAVTVRAVDPALDGTKHTKTEVITQGLFAISYNPQAKDKFAASIVGLLLGQPVTRGPVRPSEEPLVVFLAGAMERFVFAHEYGHVIKGHLSPLMRLPNGATGSRESEVFARTWQQEFDADSVGLQLLTHILLRSAQENPAAAQYYICALKAPLLFFECLELLDRARFMQEHGMIPAPLTESDKESVRSCARRNIPRADKDRCVQEMLDTHPPAWLREERLEKKIDHTLGHLPRKTAAAALKVDDLLFSVDLLWDETSAQILKRLTKQQP